MRREEFNCFCYIFSSPANSPLASPPPPPPCLSFRVNYILFFPTVFHSVWCRIYFTVDEHSLTSGLQEEEIVFKFLGYFIVLSIITVCSFVLI